MSGVAGNIIGLMVNGSFVNCEVACSINFNQEMLPASAVDSGRWKEFLAGIRDWNVSVNGNLLLEAVGADIKSILLANYFGSLPLFIQLRTRPSSTIELLLSGNALFQSGNINASANSVANWTANFQGTGALNSTFQNYSLIIDALPSDADYPIIVDENGD